ncbi:prephenate dehydratase [Sporomusa sp.]|uniref:prephenate dehydratase n=1 Tax=Sporomusa sp. TaxID=2078658 RepID=UPI002BD94F92|nr:prephenate dehydratase [Sporomusa sp.]HWR43724.1 prephenate dehydratase [Sporomusa sp.]
MRRKFLPISALILLLLLLTTSAFASVSYLGPAGTYTEEATILFFGEKESITPATTVPEALNLVKSGQCQYAVVPVENTIGGPVYNYLDAVVNDADLVVIGEVNLPIRQTLLALPGANIKEIKTIMSHPQGIAQSKDWVKVNLPGAKLVEVSSTAEAAKRVSEMGDNTAAAIAASRTAQVYNLSILANDLQYTKDNVTRFWVITLKQNQVQGNERSALVAQGPAQYLPGLLSDISRKGYKVVSIHDRPAKTLLGEYIYVVELTGGKPGELNEVSKKYEKNLKIRILGSFNAK